MRIFSVYIRKNHKLDIEDPIFLEEGFSWRAGILNVFWFLYHRMWVALIAFFALILVFKTLIEYDVVNDITFLALYLLMIFVIGIFATSLQSLYLKSKNYILHDIICAKNIDLARLKYFERMSLIK